MAVSVAMTLSRRLLGTRARGGALATDHAATCQAEEAGGKTRVGVEPRKIFLRILGVHGHHASGRVRDVLLLDRVPEKDAGA